MAAFTIVTDSNSDLVPGYAAENEIIEMELTYTMDGKTYRCKDPAYTRSAFYNEMRTGKLPIPRRLTLRMSKSICVPACWRARTCSA